MMRDQARAGPALRRRQQVECVMFRGRGQSRPGTGFRLLQRLPGRGRRGCVEGGAVAAAAMVIAPTKKPQAKRQAPARTPEPAPPA
jgi:hypothetical protein